RHDRSGRSNTAVTLKDFSLLLASAVVLWPLCVVVLTSRKARAEIVNDGPLSLPGDWFNFANYAAAFEQGATLRAFGNTALILVVSTAGTVLIGSMTAYAIDRYRLRLRKLLTGLFLLASLVPAVPTP